MSSFFERKNSFFLVDVLGGLISSDFDQEVFPVGRKYASVTSGRLTSPNMGANTNRDLSKIMGKKKS